MEQREGRRWPERRMEEETDSDLELMSRVRDGDLAAFETLVDRHKQPVFRLIVGMLGDSDESEDVAQKVFLQVYKARATYRPVVRHDKPAKFSTWLFTIARNLSLNELRRRKRHPAVSLDEAAGESGDEPLEWLADQTATDPTKALLQSELEEIIGEALRELPINQRTAITLIQEQGHSYLEIAEILGCSISAVKSLIHRGRETIRQRVRPYVADGTWEASPAPPKKAVRE